MRPLAARAFACAVCGALAPACDTGGAAEPGRAPAQGLSHDFASGSRLRARVWTVGGALEVLGAFHDTALGVDCTFTDLAAVGPGPTYACLPRELARHRAGFGPFSDPSCRQAVAAVAEAESPAYAVVEPRDACAAGAAVFRTVGALLKRAVYSYGANGECVRSDAPIPHVELGERLADDTFVRAIEVAEDRGGPIAARVLVAGDGARVVVGGIDLARGMPVSPAKASDGALRWLPSRVAFAGAGEVRFADAACANVLATKIARDAACPLSAAVVLDRCGRAEVRELGAEVREPAFARGGDGACIKAPGSPTVHAFELGDPVPSGAFVTAVAVQRGGGGSVLRQGYAAPEGEAVWPTEPALALWLDGPTRALAVTPCTVTTMADGETRCGPLMAVAVDRFADDACTQPAFVDAVVPCGGAALPALVRSQDARARAFLVVREVDSAFVLGPSGCARDAPLVPSRVVVVKEVDVASFPLVAEHLE